MADYALQYSFRQGEVLINVPVYEDVAELIGNEVEVKLGVVESHAALSASVQAQLNAAAVVAGLLNAKPLQGPSGPPQGAPAPGGRPAAAPQGEAPWCEHGQKVWKAGTSKAGNAYKGWFCGANVQGCAPTFIR